MGEIKENSGSGAPNVEGPLRGAEKIADFAQKIGAIGGVISALITAFIENKWATLVSVAVCLLSAAWYAISRWRRQQKRKQIEPIRLSPTGKAFLRGLLPFEEGENLLGRANDLLQVTAKVASSDFRFGYISGEAGSGKTSFLRAAFLPEAGRVGFRVIYIPKPRPLPVTVIGEGICQEKEGLSPDSPEEVLARARGFLKEHRLLLVYDQFEEFFVDHPSSESRKRFIGQVEYCLQETDWVAFLFAIRKEFVDDLQDFSSATPQPLDPRFSHRLRNWSTVEALEILRAAVQHDNVPFADRLEKDLIKDLEREGEVKPVEFQIVASYLLNERIFDYARYKELGGAAGILKSYVRTVIEPAGPKTPELERQIARHFLRAFCSGKSGTKRPGGLRVEDLAEAIRASLTASGCGDLVKDSSRYRRTLDSVIHRCEASYLVLRENDATFNLIHDYLVAPILVATGDVEPVQEQAGRLLDQYVDAYRRNSSTRIRWNDYKFIKKYGDPTSKAEPAAARLITKTKQARAVASLGVILLIAFIFTLISPPRVEFYVAEIVGTPGARWFMSADEGVAIGWTHAGPSEIWRMGDEKRVRLPRGLVSVSIDHRSTHLCGVSAQGDVYLWNVKTSLDFRASSVFRLSIAPSQKRSRYSLNDYCRFSPDDKWVLSRDASGDVFIWRPGVVSGSYARPHLLARRSLPSGLNFSPKGKYVGLLAEDGVMRILQLAAPWREAALPVKFLRGDRIFSRMQFSNDERWFAGAAADGKFYIVDLTRFPIVKMMPMPLPPVEYDRSSVLTDLHSLQAAFDPLSRWFFVSALGGQVYSWRTEELPAANATPMLPESRREGLDLPPPSVVFSPDGKWAATQVVDKGFFLWNLESKEIGRAGPTLQGSKAVVQSKFSPRSDWIVGVTYPGYLRMWRPGLALPAAPGREIGGIDLVRFRWCQDNKGVFVNSLSGLWYANVGNTRSEKVYKGEEVVTGFTVTPSRKRLLIFQEGRILVLGRRFSIWSIPIYPIRISKLDDRSQEW